mgnify:CR=1 FL=1
MQVLISLNEVIYILQIVLTSVLLLHVTYLDLKSREIDLKIWLFYSPLVLLFLFQYKNLNIFLYLYSAITVNVLLLVFYYISLMGGADLFLSLILSLSNASVRPLFFEKFSIIGLEPLTILLYSSLLILLTSIGNLLRNYSYTKGYSMKLRLILALSGRRIKVKDFLNSRFLFPLTQIDESSRQITIRTAFLVEEDDAEWRKKFSDYVQKGLIKEEDYIWVTWGVPVIPFMTLGYFISLISGLPL